MNLNMVIKPSKETLVVGAKVKLRNGEEDTITSVHHGLDYPVRCKDDVFTYAGYYLTHERSPKDILEVIPAKPPVDVSTFKAGDTIGFKDGRKATVVSTSPDTGATRVNFEKSNGARESWRYKIDGSWCGDSGYRHTIVKHTPKANPAAPTQAPSDPVAHPSHYTSHPSGVECIQVTQHMNFNLGNVVKYVWRNGLKNTEDILQDLKKAQWYLNKEIERLEAAAS